jgi:hypothetical protein
MVRMAEEKALAEVLRRGEIADVHRSCEAICARATDEMGIHLRFRLRPAFAEAKLQLRAGKASADSELALRSFSEGGLRNASRGAS